MINNPSAEPAQAPKTWAQICQEQQQKIDAAHAFQEEMNNRVIAEPSFFRRAEDVVARLQHKSSRRALAGYYTDARQDARHAEAQGHKAKLAWALTRSYAAAGARASRAVGMWLAFTGPLDTLVGHSRLLDNKTDNASGLLASGNGSPFSFLRFAVLGIAAPVGAAVGGAIGAAKATVSGNTPEEVAKAMQIGASRGLLKNTVLMTYAVGALAFWVQLSAQMMVLALKTGVAAVGAAIGVVAGMPFGLIRLGYLHYHTRAMASEGVKPNGARTPSVDEDSVASDAKAWSDGSW